MDKYVDVSQIYERFFNGTNGIARIHVSDIDTLPAADVEPVRHGRWLLVRPGEWTAILKCSQCGRCITIDTRTEDLDGGYPYCHCGAKMDGEAET